MLKLWVFLSADESKICKHSFYLESPLVWESLGEEARLSEVEEWIYRGSRFQGEGPVILNAWHSLKVVHESNYMYSMIVY